MNRDPEHSFGGLSARRRCALDVEGVHPIHVGALTLDLAARRCLLVGAEIALRPKEFDLLTALARQPGVAISREQLMDQVWDENWHGSTKTLDVTIASLRHRLSDAAAPGRADVPEITTLRGFGYRLEAL